MRGLGCICLEIGGVEDHIHIIAKLKPTLNVSKFVEKLKPAVTKWARSVIHLKFEWQDGYGAFSIGESQIPAVRKYIRNQKEHHKTQSFENEFKGMLTKAGIEVDDRYLWR